MKATSPPIHGWLKVANLTVAAAIEKTGIPSSTFYRLLDEEKKYGEVKSISTDTLESLINNADGHLRAEDFLDIKPVPKKRKAG